MRLAADHRLAPMADAQIGCRSARKPTILCVIATAGLGGDRSLRVRRAAFEQRTCGSEAQGLSIYTLFAHDINDGRAIQLARLGRRKRFVDHATEGRVSLQSMISLRR
jgi:hypothetical protein